MLMSLTLLYLDMRDWRNCILFLQKTSILISNPDIKSRLVEWSKKLETLIVDAEK